MAANDNCIASAIPAEKKAKDPIKNIYHRLMVIIHTFWATFLSDFIFPIPTFIQNIKF